MVRKDNYGRTEGSGFKHYVRSWYRAVFGNLPSNITGYPQNGDVATSERHRIRFNQEFPDRTFEDRLWEILPAETAGFQKLQAGVKRDNTAPGKTNKGPNHPAALNKNPKEPSRPKRKRREDPLEKKPPEKKQKAATPPTATDQPDTDEPIANLYELLGPLSLFPSFTETEGGAEIYRPPVPSSHIDQAMKNIRGIYETAEDSEWLKKTRECLLQGKFCHSKKHRISLKTDKIVIRSLEDDIMDLLSVTPEKAIDLVCGKDKFDPTIPRVAANTQGLPQVFQNPLSQKKTTSTRNGLRNKNQSEDFDMNANQNGPVVDVPKSGPAHQRSDEDDSQTAQMANESMADHRSRCPEAVALGAPVGADQRVTGWGPDPTSVAEQVKRFQDSGSTRATLSFYAPESDDDDEDQIPDHFLSSRELLVRERARARRAEARARSEAKKEGKEYVKPEEEPTAEAVYYARFGVRTLGYKGPLGNE